MEPFSQFSTYHVPDPAQEAPVCKGGCGGQCVARISKSQKNYGREYWACPGAVDDNGKRKYCDQGFNGFTDGDNKPPPSKKRAVSGASSGGTPLVNEELKKLNQRLDTLVQLLSEMNVTQERILNVLFSESPQSPV